MRLAFIISAYKLPEQLVRLVRRLQAPDTSFLIHIDKKCPRAIADAMRSGLAAEKNVVFLKSHSCYWGGFGHVAASLEGIRAICRGSHCFDYAVLLTGQDYPIKPHGHIVSTLTEADGKSFLSHFPLPTPAWPNQGMDRIERWHFWIKDRYVPLPRNAGDRHLSWLPRVVDSFLPKKRSFYPGLRPYGGGSYWCLSEEAIRFVHEYVARRPGFVRYFKTVYIPDELFFQTILLNSPLRSRIVDDDLRHIDWSDPRPGRRPTIFETKDIESLCSSSKLFARKFDATIDRDVLDMIDARCLQVAAGA